MNVLEGFRIAMSALAANKLRSALTTLGVIIGVGAVIAMVALGEGARRDIQDRITQLGSNLLYVAPGQATGGMIWRAFGSADTLTLEDAYALRHGLPDYVVGAAPELNRNVQLKYGNKNGDFRIVGTFADYSFVRSVQLESGRFFNALDEQTRRRVVVLGPNVAAHMFEGNHAIGKRIKIRGITFTVIGITASRGGFGREDDQCWIPMTTYRQRFDSSRYVRMIAVAGRDGVALEEVQEQVRRFLRRRHRLRAGAEDDFSIATQQDILTTMEESNRIFTMLLGGIAGISLFVGGIGIMNIMLVTVTERTREIGVRKALGARRGDILLQFLIESTVLSVGGGVVGILLGWSTAVLIKERFGISTFVAPASVMIAFGCALAIGIFFGLYPASQAAKLDPIEALRYE